MATEVTVVRPRLAPGVGITAGIGLAFLRGWLLMLILGTLIPHLGIGYWAAVLIGIGVRILLPGDQYLMWTKSEGKHRGQ